MEIQNNKLYENKTWQYLLPCLKHYGSTFVGYLNSIFKVAVGIKDNNFEVDDRVIYLLIDTTISKNSFLEFLEWVRVRDYYISDYLYDNTENKEKHMVVVKIPEIHYETYDNFLKGNYSKMYTTEQKNLYFYLAPDNKNKSLVNRVQNILVVLNRDKEYQNLFLNKLNEEFGTSLRVEDIKDFELDYPPKLKEETF